MAKTKSRDRAAHPTVAQRVRYRLDTALSRGPIVVVGYLGLTTLGIVVVAAALLAGLRLKGIAGGPRITSPVEAFWQSLLRVLDTGTLAGDTSWPTRIIAISVTLAGVFIAGSLIGVLATALDQRIQDLRKGRSTVLETDHTLILGWSSRLPAILNELVVANGSRKRSAVVVLADEEKAMMEDTLRQQVRHLGTTKLVCRTGDPATPSDLELANIGGARSIVVLDGPEGEAGAIRSLLAIKTLDPDFTQAHVVVELTDRHMAATIRSVTDGRIATVDSDTVIVEVTAQACHQAGMSQVYRSILDFDDSEIYLAPFPEVVGRTYAEVAGAFAGCSVMGRLTAAGAVELNPPADRIFEPGDQVVALAEDDSTFTLTGFQPMPGTPARSLVNQRESPQRLLLVGWSDLGPQVIAKIDEFVASGSIMDVVIDVDLVADLDLHAAVTATNIELRAVSLLGGPQSLHEVLSDEHYDQAVVLGYRDCLGASDADALTLVTLLSLRRLFPVTTDGRSMRVVAELLDRKNVQLAATTGVDDFIVSDEITSLMIAQLSERLDVGKVFDELFDAAGASLAFRPAEWYLDSNRTDATFLDLVAAGLTRHESVLGWRVGATGEVVVNPAKAVPVRLGVGDQVLVVTTRD